MNKTNILIVDDNQNNLLTLKTMLQSHLNAEVIESNSGEDALLKIMKSEIRSYHSGCSNACNERL